MFKTYIVIFFFKLEGKKQKKIYIEKTFYFLNVKFKRKNFSLFKYQPTFFLAS